MTSRITTRSVAAAAILLASVPLGGCTAGDAPPEAVTRDTVDRDVRAAVRKAGLDPAKGKTTSTPNGIAHPSAVDWFAVLDTPQAEQALPKIGAELERLGWHAEPVDTFPLSYEKSDWSLVGRSVTEADAVTLAPGESLLTVSVTDFGP
ncbi:hypothetical protein ACFWB2_32290 [Streptomyces virginiae]|uniref:hypothetical protein n=1 Tax=Streptomyces virginiae TaxID=1961 RepID=UPI00366430A6